MEVGDPPSIIRTTMTMMKARTTPISVIGSTVILADSLK